MPPGCAGRHCYDLAQGAPGPPEVQALRSMEI